MTVTEDGIVTAGLFTTSESENVRGAKMDTASPERGYASGLACGRFAPLVSTLCVRQHPSSAYRFAPERARTKLAGEK